MKTKSRSEYVFFNCWRIAKTRTHGVLHCDQCRKATNSKHGARTWPGILQPAINAIFRYVNQLQMHWRFTSSKWSAKTWKIYRAWNAQAFLFKSCKKYAKTTKYYVTVWFGGFFIKKIKWVFKLKFVWFGNEGAYSVLACFLTRQDHNRILIIT